MTLIPDFDLLGHANNNNIFFQGGVFAQRLRNLNPSLTVEKTLFGRSYPGADVRRALEPWRQRHNLIQNFLPGRDRVGNQTTIGLGDKEGSLKFTDALGPKNHVLSDTEADGLSDDISICTVKVTTLDKVVEQLGLSKIDFIKVDVEGFEYSFLQGAKETLKKYQPVLLMEIEKHRCTNYGIDPEEIFSMLESFGYKYSVFASDSLVKSNDLAGDLEKGRDFVFYTDRHDL